jgi:hypothetical protein
MVLTFVIHLIGIAGINYFFGRIGVIGYGIGLCLYFFYDWIIQLANLPL